MINHYFNLLFCDETDLHLERIVAVSKALLSDRQIKQDRKYSEFDNFLGMAFLLLQKSSQSIKLLISFENLNHGNY